MRLRASFLPLLLCLGAVLGAAPGCGPRLDAADLDLLQVRPDDRDPSRVSIHLANPAARKLRDRMPDPPSASDAEPYFFFALKERQDVPLISRLHVMGEELQLIPQAPLTPGREYVAVFRGSQIGLADLTRSYLVPQLEGSSAARVVDSYPRLPELPANVFRFYLWFSEPMAEGHLFKHSRLLDEAGNPVPRAFHEVELWADDHRRLTVWLSPGRTKEGLTLSEHSGAVMMPGKTYTLEVTAGLPDRRGRPMAEPFRYRFRTTKPDHDQPRTASWTVNPPRAGTRQAVEVTFPEPLDRPLLVQTLSVEAAGVQLQGEAAVGSDGRSWTFTPAQPWRTEDHTVVAHGELDDLAGNSLYRAFETTAAKARPSANPGTFAVPFQPVR